MQIIAVYFYLVSQGVLIFLDVLPSLNYMTSWGNLNFASILFMSSAEHVLLVLFCQTYEILVYSQDFHSLHM